MKLKVGDIAEFKKYEDMTDDEIFHIDRDFFPKSGKITEIKNDGFFTIEDYGYVFNPKSVARVISSKKEGLAMELKAGDIVEFKKYEDMSVYDSSVIAEEDFPESGKIEKVTAPVEGVTFFLIEGSTCFFSEKSIARVISDVDIKSLNPGDEILVKATVKEVFNGGFLKINSTVDKTGLFDVLKHKEPEYFIVKEDHYGMYIGFARELVSDKSKAKIYTSRYTANEDAADMHLNSYDVIPYDD